MSELDDLRDDGLSEEDLLDPTAEAQLAEALRAAYSPAEIDPARHALILELALEDPDAPATDEEVVESERLRQALDGRGDHEGATLARALKAARSPGALDAEAGRRILRNATDDAPRSSRRPSNVVYVTFGAAAAVAALAASVALMLRPAERDAESATLGAATAQVEIAARVALSRSTADLFNEKFEVGRTTARIDRIASARSRDLRANRYARWGVR